MVRCPCSGGLDRSEYWTMSNGLRQMSMDEQIGQLLMVGFPGKEPTPEVLDLIRSGHVGGIVLFSRNLENAGQALQLTSALQEAARNAGHPYPLLIATDQENGIVRRTGSATTRFPGSMALGAVNSQGNHRRSKQRTSTYALSNR